MKKQLADKDLQNMQLKESLTAKLKEQEQYITLEQEAKHKTELEEMESRFVAERE